MTAVLERSALRVHTFGRLHVRRAGDVVTGGAILARAGRHRR